MKAVDLPARTTVTLHRSIYPWVVVTVLMVLYTSSYIDRTILGLLVKPIRADLQISDTEYSILAGFAFVVMYSIAGIPAGLMADRWSRRAVIAIGAGFWSLATAACGLAQSFTGLFVARVGVGVGESPLSPATYSLISDYFRKDNLARALSLYALGIPIGTGLALVLGGTVVDVAIKAGPQSYPLLGEVKPWQLVFFLIGLPGLVLAPFTYFVVREPPRREFVAIKTETRASFGSMAAYMRAHPGVYGGAIFGVGLCALFAYGMSAWTPSFLQRVHGFSIKDAGLFLGLSNVVFGVAGALFSGWWADRLVKAGRGDAQIVVNMWYGLGLFVCGALGPIVPIKWLSFSLISAAPFFSKSAIGAMAALLQTVTPNRMRAQVSAVYLAGVSLIAQGLGPTAVALCTDYIFHDDAAVGYSLAVVGGVSIALGTLAFEVERRALARWQAT